ncbi:MAG: hypothetical protein K5989_09020, partial [Lachnospiraceae bacterium]|nr:hypothetical protein [Lachnospiraceae bacterium]
MNRFLRLLSLICMGVGLGLLAFYRFTPLRDRTLAFRYPSYYEAVDYQYIFLYGMIALMAGLAVCFLTLVRKGDEMKEQAVLAEAGGDSSGNWSTMT